MGFDIRKDATLHVTEAHSDHPLIQKNNEIKKSHESYKIKRKTLRKLDGKFSHEHTLGMIRKIYTVLKAEDQMLPKLQKTTFRFRPEKCKNGFNSRNIAHSHSATKQVCFSNTILTRCADVTDVLHDDNWQFRDGYFMLIELVTHEIAHWKVGPHNWRFYAWQKKYFNILLNKLISGELYK
jgi:hypothetical protein